MSDSNNKNFRVFYNDSHWLKIFHHNSRICYFNNDTANYSTNKHCFSILSKIDEKFTIYNGTDNVYSMMLELPQIPQYIRWHQYSHFTEPNPSLIGYKQLPDTNGSWDKFIGLHAVNDEMAQYTLYSCNNNGDGDQLIGLKTDIIAPYIPFYQYWVQFIDIWIELRNLSSMNLLNALIIRCTEKITFQQCHFYAYLFLFINHKRN